MQQDHGSQITPTHNAGPSPNGTIPHRIWSRKTDSAFHHHQLVSSRRAMLRENTATTGMIMGMDHGWTGVWSRRPAWKLVTGLVRPVFHFLFGLQNSQPFSVFITARFVNPFVAILGRAASDTFGGELPCGRNLCDDGDGELIIICSQSGAAAPTYRCRLRAATREYSGVRFECTLWGARECAEVAARRGVPVGPLRGGPLRPRTGHCPAAGPRHLNWPRERILGSGSTTLRIVSLHFFLACIWRRSTF